MQGTGGVSFQTAAEPAGIFIPCGENGHGRQAVSLDGRAISEIQVDSLSARGQGRDLYVSCHKDAHAEGWPTQEGNRDYSRAFPGSSKLPVSYTHLRAHET